MPPLSGALARATTVLTLAALLLGTLAVVLTTRAEAQASRPAAAPERRYAPGIDPGLDADATIGGLVLGPAQKLRDNVLVEAFSLIDPTGDPVASDLTYEAGDSASHGGYLLHVPAGDYLVRFSSPAGARTVLEPTYYGGGAGSTLSVVPQQDLVLDTVAMQADRGAPVTGRAVDAGGAPLSGADVYLVRPRSGGHYSVRQHVTTGTAGTFRLDGVRRGRTFTVAVVSGERPVTWLGGAASSGSAQTFTIAGGAAGHVLGDVAVLDGSPVSGRLTTPTGPVEEADVALLALDGQGGAEVVAWDWLVGGDETYSFAALPGTYTIGVLAYGTYDAGGWVYLGDTTDLGRAETFTVGATAYDVPTLTLRRRTLPVTVDLVDADGAPVADEYYDLFLLDRDGSFVGYADPTQVPGRFEARVAFGTEFTIEVADWWTGEWRYLGDTTSFEDATFLTVPAEGTSLHAGTISLAGSSLVAPVPALLGQARSGQVLAVEAPVWSVPDAVSSYQWLRDGWPIDGATSSAYLLRTVDVGSRVSVRVTGTADGRRGTVTSPERLVGGGSAPSAISAPTITGDARRGGTLVAGPGVWDDPGAFLSYQWYADGAPIPGAQQDRFTPGWPQVGADVSVTVTATAFGLTPGTSTSAAVAVRRERPDLRLTVRRGRVEIEIGARAAPDRTGRLTLFVGVRARSRTLLATRDHGRWSVPLDSLRMNPGTRKLSVKFFGNDQLLPDRTSKVAVRVR